MDKETLSNYGWIVICVLVLAVMLALATPFGTFVADAIKSTTQGLFDVNQNALNSTGLINIDGQEFESCPHDYETVTTGDCTTGTTSTHTCKLCGKTYTETAPAGHKYDDTGLTCTECGVTVVEYAFITTDYDSKMGTTTATDANVVIPETFEYNGKTFKVTSIGFQAFSNCTTLKSVTIPNTVTIIGQCSFQNCTSLASITIPESVTSIYRFAFSGCTSLKEVKLSKNMSTIEYCLFSSCEELESVTIPDGITSIAIQAFMDCYSLTSVVIGKNVNHIDVNAFYECYNLANITFSGTVEQWNAITLGSNWNKNVPATEVVCSDGTASLK